MFEGVVNPLPVGINFSNCILPSSGLARWRWSRYLLYLWFRCWNIIFIVQRAGAGRSGVGGLAIGDVGFSAVACLSNVVSRAANSLEALSW